MATTTIDTMVVELVGDTTKYVKPINDAAATTEKAAKDIDKATGGIGKYSQSLERGGKAAIASAGALRSVDFTTPAQGIGSMSQAMGAIPGPIGAVAGGIAGVVSLVVVWIGSMNKAKAAAEQLFQEVAAGGVTIEAAFDRARIDDMTAAMTQFRNHMANLREVEGLEGLFDISGPREQVRENLRNMLQDVQDGLSPIQRAMREVFTAEEGRDFLRNMGTTRAVSQVNELTRSLQDQAAQVGLTAEATERLAIAQRLAAQAGISLTEAQDALAPQMANLEQAQRALFERRRGQQLRDDVDGLTRSLNDQLTQLSMTPEEFQRYQLAQRGASAADLARIQSLQAAIEAQAEFTAMQERASQVIESTRTPHQRFERTMLELMELLERGAIGWEDFARAADAAEDALPEMQRWNSQVQAGVQLAQQFREPWENMSEQVASLDAALADEAISLEEYEAALQGITAQTQKMNQALQGTPAAAAGSAEALSRIASFRERLTDQRSVPQISREVAAATGQANQARTRASDMGAAAATSPPSVSVYVPPGLMDEGHATTMEELGRRTLDQLAVIARRLGFGTAGLSG